MDAMTYFSLPPIVLTFTKISKINVNEHKIMQNLKFENPRAFPPIFYMFFAMDALTYFTLPPGHTPTILTFIITT